jgi:regulation of enolase protein 1 (concanavalin A-like superfamily)
VTGDVEIVARVASMELVDPWTKAGVMVRSSLSAGAAHASMFVSAGKGIAFQRRPVAGGPSVHTTARSGGAPMWVRLIRVGSTVTSYHSVDGSAWTLTGSETLPLQDVVYVGLAVTSHQSSAAARAAFDGVSIQPR